MLIKTLLISQNDREDKTFIKYANTLKKIGINLREMFINLQEKGIILKIFKIPKDGEKCNPYEIPINKAFAKELFRSSFEMGNELFEEYPIFGDINGKVVGLRSVSKKFDSLEDAFRYYSKIINWNPNKHNNILELVKWGKENNVINYTLASFLIDKKYLELQALREGEGNINYETVNLI